MVPFAVLSGFALFGLWRQKKGEEDKVLNTGSDYFTQVVSGQKQSLITERHAPWTPWSEVVSLNPQTGIISSSAIRGGGPQILVPAPGGTVSGTALSSVLAIPPIRIGKVEAVS